MLDETVLDGGYDKLAYLIGDFPDLTAFRKFGALTAKCLLYMQAELVHLEYELEILSREDRRSVESASSGVSWKALQNGNTAQKEKILEIQRKLEQYRRRASLLQYRILC
jgi:hypothetical protein